LANLFQGNCPALTNKDAKYSVVYARDGVSQSMQIRLIYKVDRNERWLLTNADHNDLVDMVNDVKEEFNGAPGGAFYINEFGQVLVPVDRQYYLAGTYKRYLEFEFEGRKIGPKILDGIKPGDRWPGPHCGIPYTLTADGRDIRYKTVSGQRELTIHLSAEVGEETASSLGRRLAKIKGPGGGLYINEAREFFAPVSNGVNYEYLYLGPLGDDVWFAPIQA
jgi:hypothetical protein